MRSQRLNASQTLCALLTVAGLIFSLTPRAAAASIRPPSKRSDIAANPRVPNGRRVDQAAVQKNFAQQQLGFEVNRGQTDSRVRFFARGDGYKLFLSPQEATFRLRIADGGLRKAGTTPFENQQSEIRNPKSARPKSALSNPKSAVFRMTLVNSAPSPKISGEDELPGKSHYYSGKDQRKWIRDVPSYAKVRYEQVYPGVDVVYYGKQRELEYDFIVAPGTDPGLITLALTGADKLKLDAAGDLVFQVGGRSLTQTAPVIYQEANGERRPVQGSYVLKGKGRVGFRIGAYDPTLPLVIDPITRINFSTFHGGKGDENAQGVAVDSAGNAVVVGDTDSPDYPAQNEDPDDFGNGVDVFVTKFNATGTGTIYSVYLGGRRFDSAHAVAVDSAGNAYVTGETFSADFPITPGVVDERGGFPSPALQVFPEDCFVTKLNTSGGVVFSTFLAGHDIDVGYGIAVDPAGRPYVTGLTASINFPVKNEFQGHSPLSFLRKTFVTVLNSDATGFMYSTYFGGNRNDRGSAIALDSANNLYITGVTESESFPVKSPSALGPFRELNAGGKDLFVAKFNPFLAGERSLVYSTLVGGAGTDEGIAIAVDKLNRAHVTGVTGSFDFPLFAALGAEILDRENVINEAFVLSVNQDGSALDFSTFFGGDGVDTGRGIRVDAASNVYVAGNTTSKNFPVARAFQPEFGGGDFSDGFVAKFAPEGRAVLYSSYLGGTHSDVALAVDIDARGNAYVAGDVVSDDFPITAGALQRERAGLGDMFLTKINEMNADTIGVFSTSALEFRLRNSNTAGAPDITQAFGAAGDLPVKGDWDGDGTDTMGIFRPSAGQFFLNNQNTDPDAEIILNFGQVGDLPVAGDWDGDGDDEIGVFNNGTFLLLTDTGRGGNTITVKFGGAGATPVVGDWNGDGVDTIGTFLNGVWSLRNSNTSGGPDITPFTFGDLAGDLPVTGDWDGDGVDTPGIFRAGQCFLNNQSGDANAELVFNFGAAGDLPLGGDWDGRP